MQRLITLAVSCSLVAVIYAESQSESGNGGQPTCMNASSSLIDSDYKNMRTLDFRYVYTPSWGGCYPTFVKKTDTQSYTTRHACVSACGTGQGAAFCVINRTHDCSSGPDCETFYTYDVNSGKCKPVNSTFDILIEHFYDNIHKTKRDCIRDCSGYTWEDIYGTEQKNKNKSESDNQPKVHETDHKKEENISKVDRNNTADGSKGENKEDKSQVDGDSPVDGAKGEKKKVMNESQIDGDVDGSKGERKEEMSESGTERNVDGSTGEKKEEGKIGSGRERDVDGLKGEEKNETLSN